MALKDFALITAIFLFSLSSSATKPTLPNYVLSFGVSYIVVGSVLSGLGYSRLLVEAPLGIAIDKIGRRRIALAGIVFSIVGAVIGGLATDVSFLYAYVILTGLASSLFFSSIFTIINEIAPPKETGGYYGGSIAAIYLGSIVGPPLGGYLSTNQNLRMPFAASALLTAVALVFVAAGTKGYSYTMTDSGSSDYYEYLRRLFVSRRLFFVNLVGFLNPFTMSCVASTILPLYGEKYLGLDFARIGVVFAVMSIFSFLVSAPSGLLSDRVGRAPLLAGGFLFFAAAGYLFSFSDGFFMLLVPSALLGLGDGLISPSMWASLSDLVSQREKAISTGVFRTFIALGLSSGPLAAGVLLNLLDIKLIFYVMSIIALLAMIGNIVLLKKQRI